MIPQHALTAASKVGLEMGIKILQGHRLADTDEAHVAALLGFMDPAPDTLWVDVGSGFGEVAQIMGDLRPDLHFYLLNNNRWQLEHGSLAFAWLEADMHDNPLADAEVDGCMFLYSLCHADDLGRVLSEAARVTRPGGGLFVYDYERLSGDNTLMRKALYAEALPFATMTETARSCGWQVTLHANPPGSDAVFRALCGDMIATYKTIMAELMPVVWKAVRV